MLIEDDRVVSDQKDFMELFNNDCFSILKALAE